MNPVCSDDENWMVYKKKELKIQFLHMNQLLECIVVYFGLYSPI